MARPKGSKDVAPMIRGAFKRAVAELESGGRPLSEIVREHLEADFLNTLKVIAQFTPKELEATIERKRSAEDFTDAELESIAAGGSIDPSGTPESPEALH